MVVVCLSFVAAQPTNSDGIVSRLRQYCNCSNLSHAAMLGGQFLFSQCLVFVVSWPCVRLFNLGLRFIVDSDQASLELEAPFLSSLPVKVAFKL
ncbi:hypothetical protein A2U01_0023870 [Trifolium medium]|uniref:Uncharacterized protein n=1 Tax=Trifolium medium TaxID=97028 RepID=A0A392NUR3_9FABA|nr:hypothetical protein [Trifolium medium]